MNVTAEAPQDSVLRRHWQASREAQADSTQSQSTSHKNSVSESGFFFLAKIFI